MIESPMRRRRPSELISEPIIIRRVIIGRVYKARLSHRNEVRATASRFYIFYFGFWLLTFIVGQDNWWFVTPPDLRYPVHT